jgi:hypothetical protein
MRRWWIYSRWLEVVPLLLLHLADGFSVVLLSLPRAAQVWVFPFLSLPHAAQV